MVARLEASSLGFNMKPLALRCAASRAGRLLVCSSCILSAIEKVIAAEIVVKPSVRAEK